MRPTRSFGFGGLLDMQQCGLGRLSNMDFDHKVAGTIYVLAASHTDDAPDLIAVGGDHSIEILLVVLHSAFCLFLAQIYSRDLLLAVQSLCFI